MLAPSRGPAQLTRVGRHLDHRRLWLPIALAALGCSSGTGAPPAGRDAAASSSGGTSGTGPGAGGEGAGGAAGAGGATPETMPAPDASSSDAGPPDASPSSPADAAAPSDGAPPAGEPGGTSAIDDPLPACRRTVAVAGNAALTPAVAAAAPGDCLVLADGDYGFAPIMAKLGTPDAPIVIRAANRGKATVSMGNIEVTGSSNLVLEGLSFTSSGQIVFTDSEHCRLSRSRISPTVDKAGGQWVVVQGTSHHDRIDHNDLGPKRALGNMIETGGDAAKIHVVQYIRIDHNFFHDVHYGGGNGWETIRAGYSYLAPTKGFITIENNLFVAATGDPETVSVKSSDDTVRYNTFRDTNGQICLRHGNRTQVYGNFMIASSAGGTAIRTYGADHKIFNNYLGAGGILLGAGSADGTEVPGKEHYRVYRNEVVNNTIIGGVTVGGGLAPVGCTIANNLLQGGGVGGGGQGTKVMGNITNGAGMTMQAGLWKLAAGSPAIDASLPGFDYVTEDEDGQKRTGKPDVGADEFSAEAPLRGPLSEKDVGPDAP